MSYGDSTNGSVDVLSLDLDWFNAISRENLRSYIKDFIYQLMESSSLPREVYFLSEHHYLYPLTVKLLKRTRKKKAVVYNADEHHDFYYLEKLNFATCKVGCGNFFAFMAHHNILDKYVWINNCEEASQSRADLKIELDKSDSVRVKSMKFSVLKMDDVFRSSSTSLSGNIFKCFAIIRSVDYTYNLPYVQNIMTDVLMKNGFKIKKNHYRREFAGVDLSSLSGRFSPSSRVRPQPLC